MIAMSGLKMILIIIRSLFLLLLPGNLMAQDGKGDVRFVFYNVENLFDPFDDSLTMDEEFLPGGIRNWTWDRFLEKEQRIYKVLASVGGWSPPEIIGLCEVENRFVLNWLTGKTPFLKYNYRLIHQDSPDERGIDVALLYIPAAFKPIKYVYFSVPGIKVKIRGPNQGAIPGPNQERSPGPAHEMLPDLTRDILYVKGLIRARDTIHLMICHWPSRWQGYLESQPLRMQAAGVVRGLADSILSADPAARIMVAGDMNDELTDPSLKDVLRIQLKDPAITDTCLYHTGGSTGKGYPGKYRNDDRNDDREDDRSIPGTIKYQGNWYEFDHIFVSGSFFTDSSLFVRSGGKRIYAPSFLLEKDSWGPGSKPFRTYKGYQYQGGFSDHLPVYIDLHRRD